MQQQMRFGFRKPTPVVTIMMIGFLSIWILMALIVGYADEGEAVYRFLAMDASALVNEGKIWMLLTYAILHDLTSYFHVAINCLLLYFFGPELELRWGRKRFILFAVLTALSGGLFVLGGWWIGLSHGSVVGASAICLGLLVAWGLTFPDRQILFFFILPMRGIHMVWVSVAMGVLDALSLGGVSAAAHFGGMAMGAVLTLGLWKTNALRLWYDTLLVKLGLRKKPKLTVVPPPVKKGPDKWVH
jgi:membrane associated rhomboid family serine protease